MKPMYSDPLYKFKRVEVPAGSGLYRAFKVYKDNVPYAAVMVTLSCCPDTFDYIFGFSCYPEGLTQEQLIYVSCRLGIEDECYLTREKRTSTNEPSLLQE